MWISVDLFRLTLRQRTDLLPAIEIPRADFVDLASLAGPETPVEVGSVESGRQIDPTPGGPEGDGPRRCALGQRLYEVLAGTPVLTRDPVNAAPGVGDPGEQVVGR